MSVSELFDHGTPHPWANLRVNNLTIDGSLAIDGDLTIDGNLTVEGEIITPNSVSILPVTVGGPFPDMIVNFIFNKIGRSISVNIPVIQFSGAGGVINTAINSPVGAIPPNLVPLFIGGLSEYVWPIKVINIDAILPNLGLLRIIPNGRITIFLDTNENGFGNSNTRGSYSTTINYISFA